MASYHWRFLICMLFPLVWVPTNTEKRTIPCDKVCKGIRFAGKIGGCNCNYIMFTKRSSQLSRSMETEVENLEQLGKSLLGNTEPDESREFEIQDERENMQPEISGNLLKLLRRRIVNPIQSDIDY